MNKNITLEEVLKMEKPTDHFFVELKDNVPGVRFNGFKLRNMDTEEIYHEYTPSNVYELDYFADHILDYRFPNKLIRNQQNIGSTLKLCVGNHLVKDLVLVERHYIDGKLAANFEFNFKLFIPNSENTIEFIYNVPKLDKSTYDKMDKGEDIHANSDTFIFAEGKLIIHRRAQYVYFSEKEKPN